MNNFTDHLTIDIKVEEEDFLSSQKSPNHSTLLIFFNPIIFYSTGGNMLPIKEFQFNVRVLC